VGAIEGEEVAEEEGKAPAVEEEVVEGPEEAVLLVPGTDEGQGQERRPARIEAAGTEARGDRFQALRPFRGRGVAGGQRPPGEGGPAVDRLERLGEPLPEEGSAEDRVAVDDPLPGGAEDLPVERA